MNYPAIFRNEGSHILVTFPDCPGCQAFASVNDNILKLAQGALTEWLQEGLSEGRSPPRPSHEVQIRDGGRLLVVPVPDDLARTLEARWQLA
jgi:predicted RNase H-like HicB family nuclease